MFMILFLGLVDIFFAIMMVLAHYDVFNSWRIAIGGALWFMGKGILFHGSFMSVIDFFCGMYFIFIMLGAHTPLVYFFLGFMIYKLTVSFLMRG